MKFMGGLEAVNLPLDYQNEMRALLKDEYDEFIKCYGQPCFKGIRINTLKVDEQKFREIFPFKIKSAKFSKSSFYLEEDIPAIGNLPLHHAGAFYAQEPSAASAVTILAPKPGEKILDLCAAPGGKSTQIAAALAGKGLLWSNEIVKNRAQILLSNIERMGVRNAVVSSCHPELLCKKLAGFFDKVLVDAPCSGEGMFRKNPLAIGEWSKEHVKMCAKRQLSILNVAAQALKAGGVMVYSTCTFSREENEQTVYNFLQKNKNFELEEINCDFGRPALHIDATSGQINTNLARRVFPQDGGEGHFVARLRSKEANTKKTYEFSHKRGQIKNNKLDEGIFSNFFKNSLYGHIEAFNGKWVILPDGLPSISGLNVLRAGVLLATSKASFIEPAHAAFMAAKPKELYQKVDFNLNSSEILAFLRGEEVSISEKMSGYVGVCVDGITVGFGKAVNGRLKNKYPKGLRILS